jgi:hypothetical protein
MIVGWIALACVGKQAPETPVETAGSAVTTPIVAAQAPRPSPAVPKPVKPLPPPMTTDAILDPNAWRLAYNEAVRKHDAGDAQGALDAAREALGLTTVTFRREPLILVAIAAGDAGEVESELAALDELLDLRGVPWGVFWNGAIDAQADGDPARTAIYAMRALELGGDPVLITGFAVNALVVADRCDEARVLEPETTCA